jgi:cell division protein FtsX
MEATGRQERVVDQSMHGLFERALVDEPVPPPGDLVRTVMAHGTRLRRRRRLVAGGSATAVMAVVATIAALGAGAPAEQPQVAAGAAVRSLCASAVRPADDVAIFLRDDISALQRSDLDTALRSDPLVRDVRFENHDQAYAKFRVLWRDSPDFAESVKAEELPESFRVTLATASSYPAFLAGFENMGGVESIAGGTCPRSGATGEGE